MMFWLSEEPTLAVPASVSKEFCRTEGSTDQLLEMEIFAAVMPTVASPLLPLLNRTPPADTPPASSAACWSAVSVSVYLSGPVVPAAASSVNWS